MGCYGYELDGKKYSTHYVADAKGYRMVPHQGLITVYPKGGGVARKASFVESFHEDELRSSNIRYFFPDGCSSSTRAVLDIPPIAKKDDFIEVYAPNSGFFEETTEGPEETTTVPHIPLQPYNFYLPPPSSPVISVKLEIILPTNVYNEPPFLPYRQDAKKCSETCCADEISSKITIPIDKELLEKMDTNEIINLSEETNNVKMVERLLDLIEKSKA